MAQRNGSIRWLIVAGLCGCTAAAALAQSARPSRAPGQPGVVGQYRQVDPRAETMQRLMKPITIELEESRLEDVVKFLEDFSGAEIDPLWADDRFSTGLDPDREVSISANNISTLSLIERILEKADEDDFDRSTWQFTRDGALEIGPRSRLNRRAFLEPYDIRDMLFTLPDFSTVPALDLDSVLQQSQQWGGGGGSQSIFQDDDELDEGLFPSIDEEQADELIEIIISFVEPDQWEDTGGTGASIRFWQGNLLIRAPDYIHRQLRGYPWWTNNPAVAVSVARESGVTLAKTRPDAAEAGQAEGAQAGQQPGAEQGGSDRGGEENRQQGEQQRSQEREDERRTDR